MVTSGYSTEQTTVTIMADEEQEGKVDVDGHWYLLGSTHNNSIYGR